MRNSKPQCWFYNNKLIFWTQLDVYPSVGSIRISFIISLTQTLNFKCFKRVTVLRLKRKTTDRKIKPVDLMTMQGKTILPFRLDIINPPSFVVLGKGERVSFLTWYQPVLKFRSLVWRFGQGTVVSKNRLSVHYEAQKWFRNYQKLSVSRYSNAPQTITTDWCVCLFFYSFLGFLEFKNLVEPIFDMIGFPQKNFS